MADSNDDYKAEQARMNFLHPQKAVRTSGQPPALGYGQDQQRPPTGFENFVSKNADLGRLQVDKSGEHYITGPYAGMSRGEAFEKMKEDYANLGEKEKEGYASQDKGLLDDQEKQAQAAQQQSGPTQPAPTQNVTASSDATAASSASSAATPGNTQSPTSPTGTDSNVKAIQTNFQSPVNQSSSANPTPTQINDAPAMGSGVRPSAGPGSDVSDDVAKQGGLINGMPAAQAAAQANANFTGNAGAPLTLDQAMRNNKEQQAAASGNPVAMTHNQVDPNKYNSPSGDLANGYHTIGDTSGIAQNKYSSSLPIVNPTGPTAPVPPGVAGNATPTRPDSVASTPPSGPQPKATNLPGSTPNPTPFQAGFNQAVSGVQSMAQGVNQTFHNMMSPTGGPTQPAMTQQDDANELARKRMQAQQTQAPGNRPTMPVPPIPGNTPTYKS